MNPLSVSPGAAAASSDPVSPSPAPSLKAGEAGQGHDLPGGRLQSLEEMEGLRAQGPGLSGFLAGAAALVALYWTSLTSYLLFHSFAEIYSIAVAFGVFSVAWHSRWVRGNGYLFLVGVASGSAGFLDIIHTLAYKGMGVFPHHDADLPTQIWIASRYLLALSFLAAPAFLRRRPRPVLTLALYGGVVALLLLSLLRWELFPACFIEDVGLTPFKKVSEYVISAILVGAAFLLGRCRERFDAKVWRLVMASLLVTVAAELAFTVYVRVDGAANLVGHLLKIVGLYLLYQALVVIGLVNPTTLLFRGLKEAQSDLEMAYEQERQRVELLQRALLPPFPRVPSGYRVAMDYVPAGSHLLVGGDFYDVLTTASGRVVLLVGDVSGKGLEAAAAAASARSTLRTLAYETSSVTESLQRANSLLARDLELVAGGAFVTAVLVVLEPGTGRFRMACAGHPYPVLLPARGSPRLLARPNLMLGVIDAFDFQELEGRLAPGDQLVLYTDGLDEARREGEELGVEGILRTLQAKAPVGAEGTLRCLLEAARAWSKGHNADDTTLLVLERDRE